MNNIFSGYKIFILYCINDLSLSNLPRYYPRKSYTTKRVIYIQADIGGRKEEIKVRIEEIEVSIEEIEDRNKEIEDRIVKIEVIIDEIEDRI